MNALQLDLVPIIITGGAILLVLAFFLTRRKD